MNQSPRRIYNNKSEAPEGQTPKPLSFWRFFLRYPIFLLAFGPPEFKRAVVGIDTSQAHFDIWNIVQVGWISVIALRAIIRLTTAKSIHITKQVRSVLGLSFFLGFLFVVSVSYSPGRVISAEYSFLYFLNLICVTEFLVDAYQNPPNWMQCLFQLRSISFLLFVLVLLTLPIAPSLVMLYVPGAGIRLIGGNVASVGLVCATMVIVSAYCFLHSLEPRTRSVLFILPGVAGSLAVQSRGLDISLFIVLAVIAFGWARRSRRSAHIAIAGLMAGFLLVGVMVGALGGGRLWKAFNRGQDLENIETASGRTGVWADVLKYSITHPQGMGYIAGIRTFHRSDYSTNLHATLTKPGGTDNAFFEVLADAGWLALGLYLIILAKTVASGLRFVKKRSSAASPSNNIIRHSIRCALLLLLFYLLEGMESPVFVMPLFGAFYFQNITIAIILGASASLIKTSRPRYAVLA
jgi:hypothetical protein